MYNEIRSLKKKQLKFYKDLLKNEKDEYAINFINASIDYLDRELNGIQPARIHEHEKLSNLVSTLGYDNDESFIISTLLLNESVSPSYFANRIDRTKVYRVLKNLADKNIVAKLNVNPSRFMLLDKENPFKNIIDGKIKEAEKYINVTKSISKLI